MTPRNDVVITGLQGNVTVHHEGEKTRVQVRNIPWNSYRHLQGEEFRVNGARWKRLGTGGITLEFHLDSSEWD